MVHQTRVSTLVLGFVEECKIDPIVVYAPGTKAVVARGTRVEIYMKVLKIA